MGGGAKAPPALPWLRYSHRISKNYLHRTLIFPLSKVYFVQVFIQHTVTNNVIKLHSRRHFTCCFIKSTHFLCETALLYCAGAQPEIRNWGAVLGGGGASSRLRPMGVLGQSPQPPEARGSGSGAPSARKFCIFLQK